MGGEWALGDESKLVKFLIFFILCNFYTATFLLYSSGFGVIHR